MPRKICAIGLNRPGCDRPAFHPARRPHAAWLALFSVLCVLSSVWASAQPIPVVRPADGPAFRADRILIIPKAGRAAALRSEHARNHVRVVREFPEMGGVQILALPPGADAPAYVQRYRQGGHVQAAHLDHWIEPAATPDDPYLSNGTQWHLANFGLAGGVAGADIHATNAWDTLNSASKIIVAVVDSGVRQTHEDLIANLWVNPAEIAGDGLDNDGNGIIDDVHGINGVSASGDPEDDVGHGTHVAGIIGAVGNNGLGTCGVAWRVQLMICKFLGPNGGSESSLLQCLDYARTKGAKVINCSFTAPASAITPSLSNAFASVRAAGIIIVAAAGNHGAASAGGVNIDLEPQYPASFAMDNIVAVTSTTRADAFSGFNYGPNTVHLGAPGTDIFSTYYGFDSNYAYLSGTSMSAPCVSGAVALLRARFPSLGYRQIISRLLATVDPLPALAGRCITGGRLNLARALGTGSFTAQPGAFAWVPTNGMTPLVLGGNGVSVGLPLPFAFRYFGLSYSRVFVSANGLLGFTNAGLPSLNTDLPNPAISNALICPYWDDLDPSQGGMIWTGALGAAPNRKFVVSWVDVPSAVMAGGPTLLSFQAILHETGQVAFQYLQVESGRSSVIQGKSATVGVQDATGLVGTRYSFNGIPVLLTNGQGIVFRPADAIRGPPTLAGSDDLLSGTFRMDVFGPPGETNVISKSFDLRSWSAVSTNLLPASGWSGDLEPIPAEAGQEFYRAELRP